MSTQSRPESEVATDLGMLALAQQRAKIKVQDWLREQAQQGRLAYANQAPAWAEYQEAEKKFAAALDGALQP